MSCCYPPTDADDICHGSDGGKVVATYLIEWHHPEDKKKYDEMDGFKGQGDFLMECIEKLRVNLIQVI